VSQLENILPDYGCGVASLMMLLKFHCRHRQNPNYETLAEELRAGKLPSEKGYSWYSDDLGRGAYIDDIMHWLSQKGFVFAASNRKSRRSERVLLRLLSDAPAMVGMEWHEVGHWVVLVGFDEDNVSMLDPLRRSNGRFRRRIGLSRFFDQWDGAAITILGDY
jgi:uncharacterized protein YvpB